MTAEEVFCDLYDKYGDEFNWSMVPFSKAKGPLVDELKRELGKNHFLYDKTIYAVAKCDSDDDVLYVCDRENGKDVYYIFHLTWSSQNEKGFPRYVKLTGTNAVKEYIEAKYVSEYL